MSVHLKSPINLDISMQWDYTGTSQHFLSDYIHTDLYLVICTLLHLQIYTFEINILEYS